MTIVIGLKKYYDWDPTDTRPADAEFTALKAKVGQDGKYLKRVKKDAPGGKTETLITIPESEIENCMAHFARIGSPKTRAKVVAWYLEEKTMPHHASVEDYISIDVDGEPDVAKFLSKYFEIPEDK